MTPSNYITDEELLNCGIETKKIRSVISSDKNWGHDRTWPSFILGMSLLNSQSYGPRIEKRYIKDMGGKKVSSSSSNGDFKDKEGCFVELKVSFINNEGDKANLVQIRPNQNVSYHILVFDFRTIPIVPYLFILSSEQMKQEIISCGDSNAHGTKELNKNNPNTEKAIRLPMNVNNNIFQRWVNNYSSPVFEQLWSNNDRLQTLPAP